MATFKQWLTVHAPTSWADVCARAVQTAVVAFVVLQLKEWFDAGRFDTPATAVDSLLVAAGILIVSAIHKMLKS
jgi:hypothetical protein